MKNTSGAVMLFFFNCLFLGFATTTTAFLVPRRSLQKIASANNRILELYSRTTHLCLAADDENGDIDGLSTQEEVTKTMNTTTSLENNSNDEGSQQSAIKSVIQSIGGGAYALYSIFILSFGAALTLGMLLNFGGYGYTLTTEGLRIDTLEEMRMERQLQQQPSISRTTSDDDSIQNMNSNPAFAIGNFFYKQPFTASLLVTGAIVLFDEQMKRNSGSKRGD